MQLWHDKTDGADAPDVTCDVLADESKFKAEAYVRFARFEEATIITNREPEGELKNQENLVIV